MYPPQVLINLVVSQFTYTLGDPCAGPWISKESALRVQLPAHPARRGKEQGHVDTVPFMQRGAAKSLSEVYNIKALVPQTVGVPNSKLLLLH